MKIQIKTTYPQARNQWLTPVILATQEDCSLKPAWANSSGDPISKGSQFKPLYCKTNKTTKTHAYYNG
jgi:hypothetical protein